ncbi:hypothetical protein [uncultured Bifidobacterium sp.]|nr:hypothetical protein [uncultured Bifidobacterium sp.]
MALVMHLTSDEIARLHYWKRAVTLIDIPYGTGRICGRAYLSFGGGII